MTILTAAIVLVLALLAAPTSGPLRVAVAVAMAVLILVTGLRRMKRFATIPAEPEAPGGTGELRYVCSMCGLELKVESAAPGKAPSHCREPMILMGNEAPPLHPVD